jgi:hypothetical protein
MGGRTSKAVVIFASVDPSQRLGANAKKGRTPDPFAEAEVRGDDDAGALIELAQQVEQQRPTGCTERQPAQLIEDGRRSGINSGINCLRTEVVLGDAFRDLSSLTLGIFMFEGVDQFDVGEEADLASVMFDALDAEGCGDMGLASA